MIGDGGNREGLAGDWRYPQPDWSLFRESSYGHGVLDLVNASHAHWQWVRNEDGQGVAADQFWLVRGQQQQLQECRKERAGSVQAQPQAQPVGAKDVAESSRAAAAPGVAAAGVLQGGEKVESAVASNGTAHAGGQQGASAPRKFMSDLSWHLGRR